jgi:folate-binding protein YgfZ
MPIDPIAYQRVRECAGLYDATQAYGRLFARGKDAIDLLHRMSTNDMKPLEIAKGLALVTILTNEKGRIIDALTVLIDEIGHVMIVTSARKEETVIQWLDKFTIMEDARFERATEQTVHFVLLGSRCNDLLSRYTQENLLAMPQWASIGIQIGDVPVTLLKAQRIAGNGWWLFTVSEHADSLKRQLASDVLAVGGAVIDDDLYEMLRIEAGIPKAPNELNEKHNPLETTQTAAAVSFTKGCYIGQEVIARLDAQGKVQRQLVGLKFGDGVPKIGDRISIEGLADVSPLGDEIGEITSIANSPARGAIGLGYVRAKYANPGATVIVKDGAGNILPAALVQLPFAMD